MERRRWVCDMSCADRSFSYKSGRFGQLVSLDFLRSYATRSRSTGGIFEKPRSGSAELDLRGLAGSAFMW